VLLRHTGTYTFDCNAQEQVYKDLKAIFEPAAVATPQVVVAEPAPPLATEAVATVIASSRKKPKKVTNSK